MQYEITNHPTPHIFEADSREVAALVVMLLLSDTPIGAKSATQKEADGIPIFATHLDAGTWYHTTFARNPLDGLTELRSKVAAALGTIRIGHLDTGPTYERIQAAFETGDFSGLSLGNINFRAHQLAQVLQKAGEE